MRGRKRLRKKKFLLGTRKGTEERKLAIIDFRFADPYYARGKRKLATAFHRNLALFGETFKRMAIEGEKAARAIDGLSTALNSVKATKGFSGIIRGPLLIKAYRGERVLIRPVGGKKKKG
jgi:hypothetical protein